MSTLARTPVVFYLARSAELAYLQIPKAGCTSIRAAFCRIERPEITDEQLTAPRAFVKNPDWTDVVAADHPFLERCFRFTFVRDPIERFCSFHESKIHGRTAENIKPHFLAMGFKSGMTIADSIDVAERVPAGHTDPHFTPQSYFVFDAQGKCRVDLVGRLENMRETLDQVEQKSGVRLWTPRLNVTNKGDRKPARELLDPQSLARLEKFYAADIEAFGYTGTGSGAA